MRIRQAVIVSDTHCGCQFGLCPPSVALDGGGTYNASPLQQKVWAYWDAFWREWVPMVTKGEPWVAVINGDSMDGVHHQVNTLVTSNHRDQVRIAMAAFAPYLLESESACRPSAIYFVRGTECHSGKSGENEEFFARALDAVPDASGNRTRFQLRLKLDRALIDIQHHIATVNSNAYETTALQKEFVIACEEAGRWGRQVPDVIARGHRHRQAETRVPTQHGYGIVFTTPGWQLKTPLTFRMAGARQATPQFGGAFVRCGDEDIYTRHWVQTIEPPAVEELVL